MTPTAPGHQACPACGVAVVPGYVRCPKCHASLPFGTGRSKRTTADPGGTSVEATKPPGAGVAVMPIVVALVIGGAIIAGFALHGRKSPAAAVTPGVTIAPAADAAAASPPAPTPAPPPHAIVLPPPPPTSTGTPTAVNASALADTIGQELRHRRLWSTVSVQGNKLEIRSALCTDPGVREVVNGARQDLRAAGLARWLCVEDSGVKVFEREL